MRREMHARKSSRPSKVSESDVVLKVRADIVLDPLQTPLGECVDSVRWWLESSDVHDHCLAKTPHVTAVARRAAFD